MPSNPPKSAALLTISGLWQWSMCTATGTLALRAASAAACSSRPSAYSMAQGKSCRMTGEFLASAARTLAMMPSRLYRHMAGTAQPPAAAASTMALARLEVGLGIADVVWWGLCWRGKRKR